MSQALCDPFFDDVYTGTIQLPNGKPCPEFHFTDDGLKIASLCDMKLTGLRYLDHARIIVSRARLIVNLQRLQIGLDMCGSRPTFDLIAEFVDIFLTVPAPSPAAVSSCCTWRDKLFLAS